MLSESVGTLTKIELKELEADFYFTEGNFLQALQKYQTIFNSLMGRNTFKQGMIAGKIADTYRQLENMRPHSVLNYGVLAEVFDELRKLYLAEED